ncbi:hypothetical protein IAS59_006214 [Cryptococcus gattii]
MSAPAQDPPPPSNPTDGDSIKPQESSDAPQQTTQENESAEQQQQQEEVEQPKPKEDTFEDVPEHVVKSDVQEIKMQTRMIDNEIKMMRQENLRLSHEREQMVEKIADNTTKIKQNKVLPYLVSKVVEILDVDSEEQEGATHNEQNAKKSKCAVIKTSTRQTVFLPIIGLVPHNQLAPGDLIGVNKDSYLVLDKLPDEYDARVKAMEVDERPTETYTDIGGLDKQIEELVEAIVLPMQQADKFKTLGITPPKGCLMYGPPAGPALVQMYLGDGAKLVRDAFELAKQKAPAIIFIDELDAIGTKRFDSDKSGDREVQRTMLELLNQLDGFSSDSRIKVIAATNRIDILDPALLRSGRLDRKIEFPLPNESAREHILQIHSRKLHHHGVNFEELARSTEDMNGAQLKAVCVEAGMLALRQNATQLTHEHFHGGILEVQARKAKEHHYFA